MKTIITTLLLCLTGCASLQPSAAFNPPPGFAGLHIIPHVAGQRIPAGQDTVSVPNSCTNIDLTVWIGNGLPTTVFVSCRLDRIGYTNQNPPEGFPDVAPISRELHLGPTQPLFTLLEESHSPTYTPGCCPRHSGLASASYNFSSLPEEWDELRNLHFSLDLIYYLADDMIERRETRTYSINVKKTQNKSQEDTSQ